MEKKLQDQVAIITGASSGIGAGVAKGMAAAGAIVVLDYPSAREQDATESILEEITRDGGRGMTWQCDVRRENEVIEMFAQTVARYGTVDILVNNAGLQRDAAITEMTLDQWNMVIDVNLTGQFLCAREAVREFLRRGPDTSRSCATGKIICMSSVHEQIPWAGHVNYAASKGGVMLLMKSIAQEVAGQKIRVNSIAPGAIQTPINRSVWEDPEAAKDLLKIIPYKRIGVVEDIAKAAVWLASDDSDYVNGTTLFVDGGMTLYPGFRTNG